MTQKPKLTLLQRQVLDATSSTVSGFNRRTDQIADVLGWTTSAVYTRLCALERKGLVKRVALAGNVFRWRKA